MKTKTALLLICIALMGCRRSNYIRVEVNGGAELGGYDYWMERGICANVYGSDKTGYEIDLPHGVNSKGGSAWTETHILPTLKEAEALAEKTCPTR